MFPVKEHKVFIEPKLQEEQLVLSTIRCKKKVEEGKIHYLDNSL